MRASNSTGTALLLPDGPVVAGGGNPEGGHSVAWDPAEEETRIEVFSPPYLFKGARPTIGNVAPEWTYGQTVGVPTPQAAQITAAKNLERRSDLPSHRCAWRHDCYCHVLGFGH
jgi:hypothetical protein